MPTPKKGPRLGGSPAHQKAILANLATSLFEHGAITTTEAKARVLRPYAERLITKAKRGDLHNRRQVLSVIRDKSVVHVLFTEIGPRFANRPGGYTRITKIGPRKGDNAPMAVIALVEGDVAARPAATGTRTGASRAVPVAGAAVAEPESSVDIATEPSVSEPATQPATDEPTVVETVEEDSPEAEVEAEAVADQVEAQDAVATQEPQGATVPAESPAAAPAGTEADETA